MSFIPMSNLRVDYTVFSTAIPCHLFKRHSLQCHLLTFSLTNRAEQSIMGRRRLFTNSMSFTVYQVCSLLASALLLLLLLLCFTTSCSGGSYNVCYWATCGSTEFSYPVGKINSGCGDPQFQLNCSLESYPLLNFNGNEYVILQPSYLGTNTLHNNYMTIVNYNLWKSMPGGNCNPLGNYSQFWWPASHFRIAHGYTNLTLWGQCNESIKKHKRRLCGADWYVISFASCIATDPKHSAFRLGFVKMCSG